MEVILREDVQHLGAAGDVVKVKDGYARNYLLPKGLAYPATDANKKKIAYEAARIAKQRAAEKSSAETEAARIAEVRLTFPVKVGEEDKLYGSVTASDVQRKLEELGIRVDKRRVDLPEPIRELGEFRIGMKLHPDVRGMAEQLMRGLAPRGVVPHHVEGLTHGRWVLLDYVDFVVHVFHPELRECYQLERLWGDAPVLAAGAPDSGSKG